MTYKLNISSGVINILKPPKMTSFDVIAYIRKTLHVKKAGHTGTLDPLAAGVLPVCFGSATRIIEYITSVEKEYYVETDFGFQTDTLDYEGKINGIRFKRISKEELKAACSSLEGRKMQLPPIFSSIKVNGKKLYEYARKNQEVEVKKREVNIKSIDILKLYAPMTIEYDNREIKVQKAVLKIICSKGTYIRSVCRDLGVLLNTFATMSFLLRTRSGQFEIRNSFCIEEIESKLKNNKINDIIIMPDKALFDLKEMFLDKEQERYFLNGRKIKINKNNCEFILHKIYGEENKFIGIGKIIKDNYGYFIKPVKVFKN